MKTLKQVQAIVFFQGKIVLLKKRDAKFDFEKGKWISLAKAYWRLPKGKLEKGEDELQGLKRELHEECGFTRVAGAKKVFSYYYQAPKGTLRKVGCYALAVKQKPKLTRDGKAEGITAVKLFTPKQALAKLHWPREKESVKSAISSLESQKL